MKFLPTLLLSFLLLIPLRGGADVAVLVHGWSAGADTWLYSGVVPVLETRGWSNVGVVSGPPGAPAYFPQAGRGGSNRLYRSQLPAEAPLLLQAALLHEQLALVRGMHPNETLSLIGHSAGGVVARLALVRADAVPVDRLIVIAAPNLGTVRALQGLDVVDSKPFFCPGPGIDFMKEVFGGDTYDYLEYSRPALVDLVPAMPGTLIDHLNHQLHPPIEYHALVRSGPVFAGDELVPGYSQDLNQVPALRGRAQVHPTPASHSLNPADGALLARILTGTGSRAEASGL